MSGPVELFYSYAREDEDYCKALDKSLTLLKRFRIIKSWSDREIRPGSQWDGVIDERIRSAQIILFLISSDFFNSEYIWNTEMEIAFTRYGAGERVTIIPVLVRTVAGLDLTPLAKLQSVPRNGVTLASRSGEDREKLYEEIAIEIRKAAEAFGAAPIRETIQRLTLSPMAAARSANGPEAVERAVPDPAPRDNPHDIQP